MGPEFKKAIKSYIQELYSEQLGQIKEHKEVMLSDYEQELKLNQKVSKLCNFYSKIVQTITHFEWCQTCKQRSANNVTA